MALCCRICNDDFVGRNWDGSEYNLLMKKRKIKKDDVFGRNWDDREYHLPLKKRKIYKEKNDLSYNNNKASFLSSSIENNDSSTTQITKKQEIKNNNNVDDEWEIKKVLENSDVSRTLSRLLLKKELTQEFVIPMMLGGAKVAKRKGVEVHVWDVDTKSLHSLVFKIWTSAQNYVFNKRWFKDFVLRRKLKEGDQIGLQWDQDNQRFNFSILENKQDGSSKI